MALSVPSSDTDPTADQRFRSIPRMALLQGERCPGDLAVIDGDIRMTFSDVATEMLLVGRAMRASGIGQGDTVGILAPNTARWITAALGVMAAGARVLPVNTRFKGPEAAYVLGKSAARMLVVAEGFLGFSYIGMIRAAAPNLPALDSTVVFDDEPTGEGAGWSEFLRRATTVDEAVVRQCVETLGPDDDSDVMFTSGTTGHPKGVPFQHGSSLRGYEAFNRSFGLRSGDRPLVVAPFFHCFGNKSGWMLSLMAGATVVPVAVFDPGEVVSLIERERITHLAGPPTFYQGLLDHPSRRDRDLSSLEVGVVGAAYVPAALCERVLKELGLHRLMTGYGLTETHGVALASGPDDPPEVVAAWTGRPYSGVETRIVDDDGRDVRTGERGELLISGFPVMKGYLDDEEQTAAMIDKDGWLHTGDIAFASEDGNIKVCDRKKDLVIVGGFNVAPAEIDGIFSEWEMIAAAGAIGVYDEAFGEVIAAFVVPAPGATLTPEDVKGWAREHMANYKVPRYVEVVDALPVNASGKVIKADLRARFAASGYSSSAASRDREAEQKGQ
jgi:HIP---CoA ligase